MKLPQCALRAIGCIALLLSTLFFGTAAGGWKREMHDVRIIRAQIREREARIRSAIAGVGDGVPLETFKELLPNASYDKKSDEWIVPIPIGYDENPACMKTVDENAYFKLDEGEMKPVKGKSGRSVSQACLFGTGGAACYYFWRAWYSSAEPHQMSSAVKQ